jgi:TonB family protein
MRLAHQITLAIFGVAATAAVCSELPSVRSPVLLRFVAPNYHSGANSAVSDEKITAVVTVNAGGTVRGVAIQNAARTPLDDAIVHAVRKWVFTPAMKGGEVVPAKISIQFSFDAQSGELTVDLGHYSGQ